MLFRCLTALLLFVFGIFSVEAAQCSEVFSSSNFLSAKGATAISSGNLCNGDSCSPTSTSSTSVTFPTLSSSGSFNLNDLVDGSFKYTDWGLAKNNVISFSGSGTAVLYFDGSITIPKNTSINSGGSAANVMIIVDGTISIAKDANINAFIYASGNISLAKNSDYEGSISAGGTLVSAKDNTFTSSDVDEVGSGGFCESNASVSLPIVDYRFDECTYTGSGFEVIDQTGNYNAGINGVNTSAAESQVNNSLDLSATSNDDWLTVPSGVIDGLDDLTLSVWVNADNSYSQQEILHALGSSTGDDELEVYLSNDSDVYVKVQDVGTTLQGNITITDGTWHHILITRANDQVCLYVDDQFQDCDTGVGSGELSVPDSAGIVIGQEQDSFGGSFDSGQSFKGLMDEFKIFDKVLSTAEINSLYDNEYNGKNYDGTSRDAVICDVEPIVDYRFDECSYTGSGFEVIDQTGNYNAGINGVYESSAEAQVNNSLDLSATSNDDWLTVPSGVIDGLDDLTLSVWVNADNSYSQQEILHALGSSTGDDELEVYLSNDSDVYVKVQDVGTTLQGNITITDGTWHHILITRANDQVCLYVDDQFQDCDTGVGSGELSVPDSAGIVIGQEQDSFGGSFDSGQSFEGLMDEFKIFDKVLSTTEINSLYDNELNGKNYDGTSRDAVTCDFAPLVEYRFEETGYSGVADEVIDETGNFNAIAVNGATTDGALPALSNNPGTCRYGSFNDNYISLPNSFENLQDSFTITAWINPSNLDSGSRIFADDEFNQTGYAFSLGDPGNGKLRFYSRGVSPVSVDTTTSITANTWTFVTAVHDSNNKTRQIYINGVPQIITGGGTSNTYSGNWGTDNGVATIGGETDAGESNNRFTGSIDEVRVYEGALSESDILAIFAETHPCETIHHFEINHDAQGLTCVAEPLTIKACSDEACTDTISTSTDVQIFANGVLKTTVTVEGETATSVNHLVDETITLSSDQTYTCKNGSDTGCDISFANAGFLLDVNSGSDVSSCESVNFEIKAVKLSDSGVSCAPAFTGGQALDFSFSYSNPAVGTKLPVLDATSMATSGQIQTRTITFDANGEATLPVEYDDAGTLSFTLSENVSSGVSSATVTKDFYPSKMVVIAKNQDGTLLNNATSSGDPKQVAGEDFNLNFSGQCNDDTETPNYQPQSSTAIELAIRHVLPSSSSSVLGNLTVDGTVIRASEPADENWQTISTTEKELVAGYSEVGVISISIKDTDYLGNEINASGFLDVGRFYPSYFDVSITHNTFENTGTTGITDFTYIGQSFGYSDAPILTITAKNALGVTTQNYTETSFQKLEESDIIRTFPSADTTKNGVDTITKMVVEPTFVDGVISKLSNGLMDYIFSSSDTFTYTKDSNSEVSEFTISYDIFIDSITDSDGVAINVDTTLPLTVQPTQGFQRFGRLVLENSFGSETSDLAQSFEVEFLNTSGVFELNTDDYFSEISSIASNWSFSDATDDIVIGDLSISGSDGGFSGGQLKNIKLSSGGNRGSIKVVYTTPLWLQYNWTGKVSNVHDEDANATATFGVYRGNDRIISWREVGN